MLLATGIDIFLMQKLSLTSDWPIHLPDPHLLSIVCEMGPVLDIGDIILIKSHLTVINRNTDKQMLKREVNKL